MYIYSCCPYRTRFSSKLGHTWECCSPPPRIRSRDLYITHFGCDDSTGIVKTHVCIMKTAKSRHGEHTVRTNIVFQDTGVCARRVIRTILYFSFFIFYVLSTQNIATHVQYTLHVIDMTAIMRNWNENLITTRNNEAKNYIFSVLEIFVVYCCCSTILERWQFRVNANLIS